MYSPDIPQVSGALNIAVFLKSLFLVCHLNLSKSFLTLSSLYHPENRNFPKLTV